jgi:type III pantothenate kinase
MNLFAINIGNTNTQFATFSDGKLGVVKTCPTAELTSDILPEGIPVAIASVVPEKSELFKGDDIFHLTPFTKNELDTSLVDNSTIGPDRMANAIALAKFARLPAICIDCGTAITFEAVDAKNVFRGGAIMAGRMLLRKALNDYTAKLPLAQRFDAKRPSALGRNTLDAIISGCDVGVLGAAQKLIKKMQIELGVENCQVIATGGDADFFADNLIEVSSGGKDFTLRGLIAAWKYATSLDKNSES